MEDKILSVLTDTNEISWKSMIFDLVKQEGMDPWNVDVSKLTEMYLEKLRTIKTMDLHVSGKVVLAAAMLVKFKSQKLVSDDVEEFDRIVAQAQQPADFYDSLEAELAAGEAAALKEEGYNPADYEIMPHTPQPRKRKVSVYDLVKALEKALEVKHRRLGRIPLETVKLPEKRFDITRAISGVWDRLLNAIVSLRSKRVKFSALIGGDKREDKVFAFIPLLHLSNQQKIDLEQEQAFGEIHVSVRDESPPQELAEEK